MLGLTTEEGGLCGGSKMVMKEPGRTLSHGYSQGPDNITF